MQGETPRHRLLAEVLRRAGGADVEQILPKLPAQKRADIYFEKYATIVEIKEVATDRLSDPHVLEELNRLLTIDGPAMGGPVVFGDVHVSTDQLPEALARRFFQRVGKRVQKTVAHADGQIGDTKQALGLPDAEGLLLLTFRPMKMNLRVIGWAVHDELRKHGHANLHNLMMVECEADKPNEAGNSFISFHNRRPRGLDPALKLSIARAWGEITGQHLQRASEGELDRRYP